MTKKKGEEASLKEGINPQMQCSVKDEVSQAVAKLETFAHTPVKSSQTALQAKNQVGGSAARKSQGHQGIGVGTKGEVVMEMPMLSMEAGAVGGRTLLEGRTTSSEFL